MWFTSICLMFLVFTAHAASQSMVTHLVDAFQHVECISVICHAGSQLSFCKRNKTSDYCHICPVGSSQPIRVDSSKVKEKKGISKCMPIDLDCPPEAVPIIENGKTTGCKCDTLRGYAGRDFMLCQSYPKCSPGMAFQSHDGTCSPCPAGSFNSEWSYGSCTPHTNCTQHNRETVLVGNATMDTVCGGEQLETHVVMYPAVTTHAVLQLHKMADFSDGQKETIQSDTVGGETLQAPSDNLPVLSEKHTNRILTIAVLVMGISICVLALLLTVVILRFRQRQAGSWNAKTVGIEDVITCEQLMQESGNDKQGIQAEDDCGPKETPVATNNRGTYTLLTNSFLVRYDLGNLTGNEPMKHSFNIICFLLPIISEYS
ncbi:Tumor necrosis factor receptor superfamily member 19L [Mizuhopecten yessoensis]|uniref:Tumor necrosis factor receptor superfamily member 19L n=1 Tax=Mizuhopecten yessoensis TaxID=6573 RepID=A0A210QDH2_MIZYE|nr:Tumor necrosis factor receptor superfamily member 19L [Mizuhopecten yessoensis]